MTTSQFFKKLTSRYLLLNLAAMALVVALACLGVKYGLDLYTHHGESIAVPDVRKKSFADADFLLSQQGLKVVVSDTGYVRSLPPDCILEQSPEPGMNVKSGHIVHLIINSSSSPTLALPDIIDNSSVREAMAKLTAMGFKLAKPEYMPGEKDWVYGVTVRGKHVTTGDRISIEDALTLQVGSGQRDEDESVDYVDAPAYDDFDEEGDVDEFQEVTAPPSEESPTAP